MGTSPPLHPTIAAIEVARLLEYLRKRSPELASKLMKVKLAGSTERELWDERVPDTVLFDLFAQAALALREPSLPVDFGAQTRLEHLGVFGLAIRTARTVDEAVAYTQRFQRLFSNSGAIHIEPRRDELWWLWSRPGARTLGLRLANEVAVVEQVALVRELLPGATPRSVLFRHPAPSRAHAHLRYFGCRLEWSAVEEGIAWPREVFERPMPQVESALSRYFADEAARQLGAMGTQTLLLRAREAISRRLISSGVSLEEISRALGLTARQLRAGLSDEGTTLRALVDEVRRDHARTLVEAGAHSMTEIAFMLGLSETSAFSRAWRRWFGAPPRTARKRR